MRARSDILSELSIPEAPDVGAQDFRVQGSRFVCMKGASSLRYQKGDCWTQTS